MLIDFCHSRNQLIAAIEIHGNTISIYFREEAMKVEAEAFTTGLVMEMEMRNIKVDSRPYLGSHAAGTHEEKFHPNSFHIKNLLHFHYSYDKEIDRSLVDVFFNFLAAYQSPKGIATRKRFVAAQINSDTQLNLVNTIFKIFGLYTPKSFSNYLFISDKNFKKIGEEISRKSYFQEKFTSTEVINFYLDDIKNNRTSLSDTTSHGQLINATCAEVNSLTLPSLPTQNHMEATPLMITAGVSIVAIAAGICWAHLFMPAYRRRNVNPRRQDDAVRRPLLQ